MKIKALHNVEVAGYGIVKRGEIIDFAKERIDERIAANFLNAANDARLKAVKRPEGESQPDLIEKTKEEMLAEQDRERAEGRKALLEKLGPDGIREQLAELGVSMNSGMSDEKLADMLLDHLGE